MKSLNVLSILGLCMITNIHAQSETNNNNIIGIPRRFESVTNNISGAEMVRNADTNYIITIAKDRGLRILKCHDGDEVLITIKDTGFFKHQREFLAIEDLSMAKPGTNILTFQTICRGVTGEISTATVNIIKPVPAPVIKPARAGRVIPPMPPIPGVPHGVSNINFTNTPSARDYQRRLDKAAMFGWRRSQ